MGSQSEDDILTWKMLFVASLFILALLAGVLNNYQLKEARESSRIESSEETYRFNLVSCFTLLENEQFCNELLTGLKTEESEIIKEYLKYARK